MSSKGSGLSFKQYWFASFYWYLLGVACGWMFYYQVVADLFLLPLFGALLLVKLLLILGRLANVGLSKWWILVILIPILGFFVLLELMVFPAGCYTISEPQIIRKVWGDLGSFKTRMNRSAYIIFSTCLLGMFAGSCLAIGCLFDWLLPPNGNQKIYFGLIYITSLGWVAWEIISVMVRRLNDLGSSKWWFLSFFIPFLSIVFFIRLIFLPGLPEEPNLQSEQK